jgi:carbon-monoxide dehydrogenase medium subunit
VKRENGSIAEARVALTNIGPTPLRLVAVEGELSGAPATVDDIAMTGTMSRPTVSTPSIQLGGSVGPAS